MAALTQDDYPRYIIFMAEDTFSPLIWDDEDCGIGDVDCFRIGDKEYSLESLEGIKEWFYQADKYDPYSDVTDFQVDGMEEWINKGYQYALQVRDILPDNIALYYGFWHQFGDGKWRYCRAHISNNIT